MKLYPPLLLPMAMSAFLQPRTTNIQPNGRVWGVPANNNLGVASRVPDRASAGRLHYSDEGKAGDLNHRSDEEMPDDEKSEYLKKFNEEKEEIKRSEKYPPQEIFRDYILRKWRPLQEKIKDGANPDMDLKGGSTLAHLIAGLPSQSLHTSTYKNSLYTLKLLGESGYDFGIKDNAGLNVTELARSKGNDDLASEIEKIQRNQLKVPTNITDINDGVKIIASQVNPSKIGRQMVANYLRAGADVDSVVTVGGNAQQNTTLSHKMPTTNYLDSLESGTPKNPNSIRSIVEECWDKPSADAFVQLADMAKDNAEAVGDQLILKKMNITDRDINKKVDEMGPKWDKAVEDFVGLARHRDEGLLKRRDRGVV